MYPIFRPLLNKGGAGRSLSRYDTAEALKPLLERHAALLVTYEAVLHRLSDRNAAAEIEKGMNRLRTELGKIRETILSNGGSLPTMAPAAELGGQSDHDVLRALDEAERAYLDALRETLDYPHHQIRTIAILENNVVGSEERQRLIRPVLDDTPTDGHRGLAPVLSDEVTGLPADIEPTTHHEGPEEQPATQRREDDESGPGDRTEDPARGSDRSW
jgi:hypothetical protein